MTKAYDHLFKLLLVGDSGVGKTGLLVRFADDKFSSLFLSTIGIDFKVRTLDVDGRRVKIQIWDTAGQERFRAITTAYYRGAMGILLVYDITNEKSFENILTWMRTVDANSASDVLRMIVANKHDMDSARQVSRDRGQALATEHACKFVETSAKSNMNVEHAFLTMARDIMLKVEQRENNNTLSTKSGYRLFSKRGKSGDVKWKVAGRNCTIL